jgi:hypothetical protein
MASPFSIFRKKQKVMIATLGVLTMFAFVFIPVIMQGMRGRTYADPVAVKTTKFGDLRESDLRRLRESRQKVRLVLADLLMAAYQKAGLPPQYINIEGQVDNLVGPATEAAVVEAWLKSRNAAELGIVIADPAINGFIASITNNLVTPNEIEAACKRASISTIQLFEMLRDELLASQFENMFTSSIATSDPRVRRPVVVATPAQRWDYYNRLNCQATIQAIALPVANYLDQVSETPSEEELQKFFDEHKENYLDPNSPSPEPGFKVPHKIAVEYIKGEVEPFAAKVTDAEILAQYEKHKDAYDQRFRKPEPKPIKLDAPKDAKDTKATETPKKDKDAAKKIAPPTVKPDAAPKKTEPTKTEPKTPDKAPESKKSSSAHSSSPFMLTSMLVDDKKADAPVKTETPTKPAVPAKDESAAKKAEPVAKKAEPAAKESPKAEPQKPAAKPAPTPQQILEDMPVEMKTSIRNAIAAEKIAKLLVDLRKPMDEYQKARKDYDLRKLRLERDKKAVPPPPAAPDFDALAKKAGLSLVRTGLMTAWQARDKGLNAWMPAEVTPAGMQTSQRTFILPSLYKSPAVYRPLAAFDGKACYLFWKTEDKKEYVPKFADVQSDVLLAWKMIRARKIAEKAADTMVAEANKKDEPLKVAFPKAKVLEPPKFSWMTEGNTALNRAQGAEISKVAELPMVGEDFMKVVFRLDAGKAAVAMNAPQTVVYVVQPIQFVPSRDVRWTQFAAADYSTYATIGQNDMARTYRAWFDELNKTAGLKWVDGRKPDVHKSANAKDKDAEAEQPSED